VLAGLDGNANECLLRDLRAIKDNLRAAIIRQLGEQQTAKVEAS
jgi:hypothetical protein